MTPLVDLCALPPSGFSVQAVGLTPGGVWVSGATPGFDAGFVARLGATPVFVEVDRALGTLGVSAADVAWSDRWVVLHIPSDAESGTFELVVLSGATGEVVDRTPAPASGFVSALDDAFVLVDETDAHWYSIVDGRILDRGTATIPAPDGSSVDSIALLRVGAEIILEERFHAAEGPETIRAVNSAGSIVWSAQRDHLAMKSIRDVQVVGESVFVNTISWEKPGLFEIKSDGVPRATYLGVSGSLLDGDGVGDSQQADVFVAAGDGFVLSSGPSLRLVDPSGEQWAITVPAPKRLDHGGRSQGADKLVFMEGATDETLYLADTSAIATIDAGYGDASASVYSLADGRSLCTGASAPAARQDCVATLPRGAPQRVRWNGTTMELWVPAAPDVPRSYSLRASRPGDFDVVGGPQDPDFRGLPNDAIAVGVGAQSRWWADSQGRLHSDDSVADPGLGGFDIVQSIDVAEGRQGAYALTLVTGDALGGRVRRVRIEGAVLREEWSIEVRGETRVSALPTRIYVADDDGVSALNLRGELLWRRPGRVEAIAGTDDFGVVVVRGSEATRLDRSGHEVWSRAVPGFTLVDVAVGPGGRVAVAGSSSGGSVLREYDAGSGELVCPNRLGWN